jgi:hypothetical protein
MATSQFKDSMRVGLDRSRPDADAWDKYLIFVWGDVEPSLRGPYKTDGSRLTAARSLRRNEGDENGLYRLDVQVTKAGKAKVRIDSFSGGEMDG